jgi:hypothetical protein
MGLLNIFSKARATVHVLPSGSMTLDRNASILASTISSSFPDETLQQIGTLVLGIFKSAAAAQAPLTELKLHFPSLLITARELRGGAVVFFSPKHLFNVPPQQEKNVTL